jgi:dTDP-4-amino-4,6-dideoxygalactose transaminase
MGDFPVTERVVREILSLPMFAELTDEAIRTVSEAVKGFVA